MGMYGYMRTAAVTLAAATILGTSTHSAQAAPCTTCSPDGCVSAAVGFSSCWFTIVYGFPICTASGYCGGGGLEDDMPSKRRSPRAGESVDAGAGGRTPADGVNPHGSPGGSTLAIDSGASAPAELRLYWVTLPVAAPDAARLRQGGTTARRSADPARPDGMLRAAADHLGIPPARLRAASAEALVGPGALSATFVTPEGDGYTIEAAGTRRGARVAMCRVIGRAPAGQVATGELEPGDLLLVPLRLQGQACVMALTVAPSFAMDGPGRAAEERMRLSFRDAAVRMTREGGHKGFRMEMLPQAVVCP